MIGVIGAGAWGTALAQVLASDGHPVRLWAREPELVHEINALHTNSLFLPGASLSPGIAATGALADLAGCAAVLVVVPAQFLARVLADLAPQADTATRAAAIAAADGSPGAALAFVEQDLAPLHAIMTRLVAEGDESFALRGALAGEVGARPDRERLLATLDLARAVLAGAVATAVPAQRLPIVEAHAALASLTAQVPTFNYDPGLLAMEIGGLLASAALPRETA